MATTGRSAETTPAPERAATLCRESEFVHLVGSPDGDSLAAIGVLGRALDTLSVPYQASIARTPADAATRLVDGGESISIGLPETGDTRFVEGSLAVGAYETARILDTDPDPILAIAGAIAGGFSPTGPALEAAEEAGVQERPGLGLPTADLTTGLAYSGWLHAEFSGDEQQAGAFLADIGLPAEMDDDAHTRLASTIALEITGAVGDERPAAGLADVVAPLSSPGPFETVEGHADVLDAVAMNAAGIGLAFVLGHTNSDAAVEEWKTARERLHRTVHHVELEDWNEFQVGTAETQDPRAAARLVRDFRADGPVVIVGQDAVALAIGDRDAGELLRKLHEPRRVIGNGTLAEAVGVEHADTLLEELEATV